MCGIAGAVCLDGSSRIERSQLSEMADTMAHRGPDGAGTWLSEDGRVGFGHRRLAVIDPTSQAAAQPMSDELSGLHLTYNGEIYNHADVRRELERAGHRAWRTDHSDTEVVLRAFAEWGIGCLERLRGMFAFALYDERRRQLWLVRDRIGVKPLYWTRYGGRLAFASEIKALLADPALPRAVDETALFHYLSFLTTPAPQTLFAGINKLPPGSWLRVDGDGQITTSRWYDVWDHTTPLVGVPEQEIAERVLATLRESVQLRKVSDVPVGVFLSGGVDSSTNAALFAEGATDAVRTFSVGYSGDNPSYPNELDAARRVAAHVGAQHAEVVLDLDDLVDFLPGMVSLQDEPLADPVCVPLFHVSKLARDSGVVVCQVGEGADELFAGYPAWHRSLQLQRLADLPVPGPARRAALAGLRRAKGDEDFRYEYARRAVVGEPVFWSGAEGFTETAKRRLLSPRLRAQTASLSSWDALSPMRQHFLDKAWDTSPLHWMTHSDLHLRLPELLLMRVDKMTMGCSLEARVPFLDHRFVELALSIPAAVKVGSDGVTKRVLKQAVRGVVPDEVIDRRKQGFGVPLEEYFVTGLGEVVRRELREFCASSDLLDWPAVERLLDGPRRTQAWYLLNLALWWKRHIA